jgi:colicin import membrane protein
MAAAAIQQADPGRTAAGVLSAAMHLMLLVALVVGVNWQSSRPEAVAVELWQELPRPEVETPKVEPKPEVKPEPPKPEIKPQPRPEPPPPKKPDIATEKAKPAPREPAKKAERLPDLDFSRDLKEQAQRELESVQREREKRDALSQFQQRASVPSVKGDPRYADRVSAKIKGLIILPQEIRGNPEAVFDVEQLPTGEVTAVKLRTTSGNSAYDDAVERAIRKASPLPRPDAPNQPPRLLELRFRPQER